MTIEERRRYMVRAKRIKDIVRDGNGDIADIIHGEWVEGYLIQEQAPFLAYGSSYIVQKWDFVSYSCGNMIEEMAVIDHATIEPVAMPMHIERIGGDIAGGGEFYGLCPSCKRIMYHSKEWRLYPKVNCCDNCGQRVGWMPVEHNHGPTAPFRLAFIPIDEKGAADANA